MNNLKRLIILAFLLSAVLSFPASAFSWGQATHAYFAKELSNGQLDSGEIYGAVAPDIFNLMFDSPYYDYLVQQTHHQSWKVKMRARRMKLDSFAFGFISHNESWGADYTAHIKGLTTQKGYVITKHDLLAPKFKPKLQGILSDAGVQFASLIAGKLADGLAHSLIETAIDLLIIRNEDPLIGVELSDSAQSRPAAVPDLLVAAYAGGLSHTMKISPEDASGIIREAESGFRQIMIHYGEILTEDEPVAMSALADQGAALIESYVESIVGAKVDIPSEVIVEFLGLAVQEVEDDYQAEIEATLSYLKGRKELSNYLRCIQSHSFLERFIFCRY
jgi:hypothetical protein